mgnify:FL=1
MNISWSIEEIEWLKNNYSEKGVSESAKILNKSNNSIVNKAFKLGLKVLRNKNIKSHLFITSFCKESVYLLGYLFADGHIRKSKKGYEIVFHCSKDDMINIMHVFEHTGKWNILERTKNGKKHLMVRCFDSDLGKFLIENNYDKKSLSSANKILSHIPNDLWHCFFLGLIDGDGCWYYSENNKQFIITGHYDHNWDYFRDLLTNMNISFLERKTHTKCGSNSQIRVCKKRHLILLIDFLYPNNKYEIGLLRKFNKAIKIKSSLS